MFEEIKTTDANLLKLLDCKIKYIMHSERFDVFFI